MGRRPFFDAQPLHYQDGVMSFIYRSGQHTAEETWLVAVDIREHVPVDKKIRLAKIMQNSKFFVRNDSNFLYVGTYNGTGCQGHREWVMQGYDLATGQPFPALQLPSLYGSDLRLTLVFEIYDGYLYASSNQSSFEVEEIDWTSYYHCCRFPLRDPTPEHLERRQIFRRQHRDGPINDSWTDIALDKDERTGTIFITECRREWKQGGSDQQRTYYSAPLLFSDEFQNADSEDVVTSTYPADDPLAKVLDEKSRASWSASVPHLPRNYHPEPVDAPHSFLLSKTKYRTFIPSSLTHLDLVIDDWPPRHAMPVPVTPRHWGQQVRLRLGSRAQCSPTDPKTNSFYDPTFDHEGPIPDSEERFKDRGIDLWPPTDAPVELLDLLNPAYEPNATSRFIGDVFAVADERSLAYMSAPLLSAEGENRNIVLVNFDPDIRFPRLDKLKGCGFARKNRVKTEEKDVVMKDAVDVGKGKEKEKEVFAWQGNFQQEGEKEGQQKKKWNWWSLESAKYLEIGRGFKFDYGREEI